jgi:hypothetical protein
MCESIHHIKMCADLDVPSHFHTESSAQFHNQVPQSTILVCNKVEVGGGGADNLTVGKKFQNPLETTVCIDTALQIMSGDF